MTKHTQGWNQPIGAKRWHYFTRGRVISLCGSARAFDGERKNWNHSSRANCENCKRLMRSKEKSFA